MNRFSGKSFLLTGGAGFIGSSMAEKLLGLGAKVLVIDNLSTGKKENIQELMRHRNFYFYRGDVNRKADLAKIFRKHKIDYLIHYAAVVGVKKTLEKPLAVLRDLDGIRNVLELARKYGVKKAVFASSSEVYGEPQNLPVKEDETPLNTRLPYAAIKAAGENYFRSYHEVYGLPTVSLRFFNVYGPKQESSAYGFVTAVFMKQVLSGKPPTIFGDGRQTRDFVFIEDNLNATLKAFCGSGANGGVINIGTGREIRILDLAKKIIGLSGKKLKPTFLPARKTGDMKWRRPDVAKMKKLLGYRPRHTLDQGLKKTMEWYRSYV